MNKVQKWEVAGVPTAILFSAAYNLGWLARVGVSAEQLPDLMIVLFVASALARMGIDYVNAKKSET